MTQKWDYLVFGKNCVPLNMKMPVALLSAVNRYLEKSDSKEWVQNIPKISWSMRFSYLFIYLFIYLCIYLFICLFIYLFIYFECCKAWICLFYLVHSYGRSQVHAPVNKTRLIKWKICKHILHLPLKFYLSDDKQWSETLFLWMFNFYIELWEK